jgi:hypothetical protein
MIDGGIGHALRMPKHVPLPRQFRSDPFLYTAARAESVGAGRLRGPDLATPFRGVRVPLIDSVAAADDFLNRCAAYAPLLTAGRFFSHSTAARLWEVPLSQSFSPLESLHVSSIAPHPAPRMVGITGHQIQREAVPSGVRHGFPASDPVDTWLSLGGSLTREELVVAADHLILDPVVLNPHDVRPHTDLHRLAAGLERFHGRGAHDLRWALTRARMGAESRPESLLRLLILSAGLPEPAVNVSVTDRNGRVLGRGDLVYKRWRTVVEYDGDHHRTNTFQYERDINRLESFRNADWRVVQVRSRGLFVARTQTRDRILLALRAGGWHG